MNFERFNAIKCKKCVTLKWSKVFCNIENENERCESYNKETNLTYFSDINHYHFMANFKIKPYLNELADEMAKKLSKI